MTTTVLEHWQGAWWRWYLYDGQPYAFLRVNAGSWHER